MIRIIHGISIIAIAIVFSILWKYKTSEEKKITNKHFIRTKPSKAISVFYLGTAFVAIGGGMILSFINGEFDSNLLIITLIVCMFAGLGFFGYAWERFNYVVTNENTIIVYRLFGKKKQYCFDEIFFFKDTTRRGISGELICYNENKKKMFSVAALQVGVSLIIQLLKEKNITEI